MALIEQYPSSISQITLKTWIDWEQLYGINLSKKQDQILNLNNEDVLWVERSSLTAESAVKSLSFFTDTPLEEIKSEYEIGQVLSLYLTTQAIWDGEITNIKNEFQDGKFIYNQREFQVTGLKVPDPVTFEFIERVTPDAARFVDFINGDWGKALGVIASQLSPTDLVPGESILPEYFETLTMDKVWYTLTLIKESFQAFFTSLNEPQ